MQEEKPNLLFDMVKPGRSVKFNYYRDGELWYTTDTGFQFPVSIEEAKGAVFLHEDRAILFMRFIRKHMAGLEKAREEQGA